MYQLPISHMEKDTNYSKLHNVLNNFFSLPINFHEVLNIEQFKILNMSISCSAVHPESAQEVYICIAIDSVSLQTQLIISV